MGTLTKSFVTLDKDGGSGNGVVTASANSNNTGRNARQVSVTFSAVGCENQTRTIIQKAKGEFNTIQETAAAAKTGQTLTLTGTSNSSALTFSVPAQTDNIGLTLPANYTANGVSTPNGTAITGDPGATAQYDFSIQFTIPANETIDPKTAQVVVTDDGGTSHTCTITLAAGDAYLTVGQPSGELNWDGSNTVTINVTSNAPWTVA